MVLTVRNDLFGSADNVLCLIHRGYVITFVCLFVGCNCWLVCHPDQEYLNMFYLILDWVLLRVILVLRHCYYDYTAFKRSILPEIQAQTSLFFYLPALCQMHQSLVA